VLIEQLRAERAQHAFNMAELERQNLDLLKELAAARLELDRRDAFGHAPSPSEMTH
jgi:hypothetical protein